MEIKTQNKDRAAQAITLNELGNLYNDALQRAEEAVTFFRQAADIAVEMGDLAREGTRRNNIANTLCKLKRYDEARVEIMRAIECKSQVGLASSPWTSFDILSNIERADGNHSAARAAWTQARDAYLAYRRQGGYAQHGHVRFAEQIVSLVGQQKVDEIQALFDRLVSDPNTDDSLKQLIHIVITILNGSRDKALGDDPALYYADAAEVLFLIERLGG